MLVNHYFAGDAVAVALLAVAVAVLLAGADAVVVVVVSVVASSFLLQPTSVTTATKAMANLFMDNSDFERMDKNWKSDFNLPFILIQLLFVERFNNS